MNLLTSMAFGTVNRISGDNRSLNNHLDEANANIHKGQEIINRQHAQNLLKDKQVQGLDTLVLRKDEQIQGLDTLVLLKDEQIRLRDIKIKTLNFELKRMTALREADVEARKSETSAWRKEHQSSIMHNIMGQLKNGSPLYRNAKIWNDAFDAACAVRNIGNPEAWRLT